MKSAGINDNVHVATSAEMPTRELAQRCELVVSHRERNGDDIDER